MNPPKLRILFCALGYIPIPPKGYGGIESIIWEYADRLRARGHSVDIINVHKHRIFWDVLRAGRYDFVHCHHERGLSRVMAASRLWGSKVIATTHRGYFLDRLDRDAEKCLRMTAYAPRIMVIREDVASALRERNPASDVVVQPNGTEAGKFRCSPHGNGRALCLGVVEPRKRQDFVHERLSAAGISCHFAGPIKEPILPPDAPYLGEWTREIIRERLTDYSALILVSDREGGGPPLVVAEALAAGLSVVVSPMAYGNLDLSQPFIHPVESDNEFVEQVRAALATNEAHREEARRYCLDHFDWDVLVARYEAQLLRWSS